MHLPMLIKDLAFILGVAAIVTFIFRRIRQPVVLGYILAGFIVGEHSPGPHVADVKSVQVWAELGVIFLMFSLGLEFSFRKLAKVGSTASITAIVQILTMLGLGYVFGQAVGWSRYDAIFLGAMIAISSTTIIIKAFEELGLKGKRFAEIVFGILIVEDLAAIIILVGLSTLGTSQVLSGWSLAATAGQLILVVVAWFLVGMFAVPRFVSAVVRHGNHEMLVVMAVALCLGLVTLADALHYSVALGAFMMGSILSETREASSIEHLMEPLRDLFGAIFFVSVGMMLDPTAIVTHWVAILGVTVVIILGKVLSVSFGGLATGQSIDTSVRMGLSMAQVGEFSFIIATLGLSLKVINPDLYPIIVASSLLTTFLTPYFIKGAAGVSAGLQRRLPSHLLVAQERYAVWFSKGGANPASRQRLYRGLARWGANAVVIVLIFSAVSRWLPQGLMATWSLSATTAYGVAWALAFTLASPFIWALATTFRSRSGNGEKETRDVSLIISLFASVLLVGFLSAAFFSWWVALGMTVAGVVIVFLMFRGRLEAHYRWYERQFLAGFSEETGKETERLSQALAPWDARLVELVLSAASPLAGMSLAEAQLREKYGINVIAILRGNALHVPPLPSDRLFPQDHVLCFGEDADVERFQALLNPEVPEVNGGDLRDYRLAMIEVDAGHPFAGLSLRAARLREGFGCIAVGLERNGQRFRSPGSDMVLEAGDLLWVVGRPEAVNRLRMQSNLVVKKNLEVTPAITSL